MLFSSREVADFIKATFEPAWESVRPAPIVTIDFGNDHVVKRTLQGNIATYVCGPDGTVYDVLPGIYAPDVYRKQLEALKVLAASLQPKADLANKLNEYHTQQARLLQAAPAPTPQMQAIAQTGGGYKGGGFGNFQGGGFGGGNFQGGGFGGAGITGNGGQFGNLGGQFGLKGGIETPTQRVIAGVPLALRAELKLDSEVNERIRRRLIHERLAGASPVRPNDIKKWLFKDVLHADLDDPFLGLGGVLNANYPFADEDRAAGR